MDSLDLQGFGTTLAVGLLVFAGVLALAITFRPSLGTYLWQRVSGMSTYEGAACAVLLSAVLLVVGIFGEDVSNKFVDADYDKQWYKALFPTEFVIRERVFKGKVGVELAASGRVSRYMHDAKAQAAAAAFEQSPTESTWAGLSEKERKAVVNGLYYTAKNTLVRIEGIRGELAAIQTRIDFSRSFATYAMLFAVLALILGVWQMAGAMWWAMGWPRIPPFCWMECGLPPGSLYNRWRATLCLGGRWLRVGISFVCLYLVTWFAYECEEREYNVRVFGYFATLDEKDLPNIAYSTQDRPRGLTAHPMKASFPEGISGMALLGNGRLVLVHDTKDNAADSVPRASLVLAGTGQRTPLVIDGAAPLPSDLEAVCAVPGTRGEMLLCESGYYTETVAGERKAPRNGRIFWVALDEERAVLRVVRRLQWPAGTEDVEAVACVWQGDKLVLLAGHRDGRLLHAQDIKGVSDGGRIVFTTGVEGGLPLPEMVSANLRAQGMNRLMSDFHVAADGTLWASAAYDPGDATGNLGPFRSVIYALGRLKTGPDFPVELTADAVPSYVCEGVKVEALTGGAGPGNSLIYGTDDEALGGIWRPLGPPLR